MELLLYALGAVLTIGGGVLLLPGGMAVGAAVFAWLRDSRLAQVVTLAVFALVALLALRRDAVKAGKAEALRDVEAANRQALNRRIVIDTKTERDAEQVIRDELKGWSK